MSAVIVQSAVRSLHNKTNVFIKVVVSKTNICVLRFSCHKDTDTISFLVFHLSLYFFGIHIIWAISFAVFIFFSKKIAPPPKKKINKKQKEHSKKKTWKNNRTSISSSFIQSTFSACIIFPEELGFFWKRETERVLIKRKNHLPILVLVCLQSSLNDCFYFSIAFLRFILHREIHYIRVPPIDR